MALIPGNFPGNLAVAAPPQRIASAQARSESGGAPTVVLLDVDGVRRELGRARGRALLVHLWATWCQPCVQELPTIDRLARDLRREGIDVLSVSFDREQHAPRVARLLQERAPTLTAAIAHIEDPRNFVAAFTPEWNGAIPAMFVFDAQGVLRRGMVGEIGKPQLDTLVAELRAARQR